MMSTPMELINVSSPRDRGIVALTEHKLEISSVDSQAAFLIRFADYGEVLELADRQDLGSCTARCGGSIPPFPTNLIFNDQGSRHAEQNHYAA